MGLALLVLGFSLIAAAAWLGAVDPAGSVGRDRYAYAIVAAALLVLAGVSWRQEIVAGGWRLYRRVGLCPGESASS